MSFGSAFTVGVEEELLLVDPLCGYGLSNSAAEVLRSAGLPSELASHEVYACEVELRSPACGDVGLAVESLRRGREALCHAGATLVGAGLHPSMEFGTAELVDSPRYRRVHDEMRGLITRSPECALHVHIGMPDAETAVHAANGMRVWLPLLQAVSANSPWWFGRDSGMASSRWAMVRAYPGRGVPPVLADYAAYEELVATAGKAGGFADYTYLWWDVRPHPRHGTIEIREMDAQSRSGHVQAVAALTHALAILEAERPRHEHLPSEAIGWSVFRAARDGMDAEILDGSGEVLPVGVVLTGLLRKFADRTESWATAAAEGAQRLLEDGSGSQAKRRTIERAGFGALLPALAALTTA
ncbi:MAG: YbdK family carboxylate-amine ligase [Actinomycetota bacterium]|nr:YbdK family carboxylate-amine ligase [Actinomycetota bacterium]